MNAPAAADVPSVSPISASPKHIARLVISSASLDLKLATKLMMRGAASAPANSAHTKNTPSFAIRSVISPTLAVPVVATPVSTLSSSTAAKSSTTKIPTISRPCRSISIPLSRSTLTITAELLMDSAAPRKIASVAVQPSSVATA